MSSKQEHRNKKLKFWAVILLPFLVLYCGSCSLGPTSSDKWSSASLKITGDYTGCGIGSFLGDGNLSASGITTFENTVSRDASVIMWFIDFRQSFPSTDCDMVNSHHAIPMLTWEPWNSSNTLESTYSLDNIINGNCDTYITTFAADAKTWGKPIFLRWAHEMNGTWYPWCGNSTGSSETKYITAWKRIHATFEAVGVKNVTWVWCPNANSVPDTTWNAANKYYPGDPYVDWIAYDGYAYSSNNTSFNDVFSGIYGLLSTKNKPHMIGEFAKGDDGDKTAWISDVFTTQIKNNYTKIKLFVWFDMNKENDWRIGSPSTNINSTRSALNDAYYISKIK